MYVSIYLYIYIYIRSASPRASTSLAVKLPHSSIAGGLFAAQKGSSSSLLPAGWYSHTKISSPAPCAVKTFQ